MQRWEYKYGGLHFTSIRRHEFGLRAYFIVNEYLNFNSKEEKEEIFWSPVGKWQIQKLKILREFKEHKNFPIEPNCVCWFLTFFSFVIFTTVVVKPRTKSMSTGDLETVLHLKQRLIINNIHVYLILIFS